MTRQPAGGHLGAGAAARALHGDQCAVELPVVLSELLQAATPSARTQGGLAPSRAIWIATPARRCREPHEGSHHCPAQPTYSARVSWGHTHQRSCSRSEERRNRLRWISQRHIGPKVRTSGTMMRLRLRCHPARMCTSGHGMGFGNVPPR
jgi:hypothetical protein